MGACGLQGIDFIRRAASSVAGQAAAAGGGTTAPPNPPCNRLVQGADSLQKAYGRTAVASATADSAGALSSRSFGEVSFRRAA